MDQYLMKVLLVGDTRVGKTQIANRLLNKDYNEDEIATIGIDFRVRILELDNRNYRLQIWDTAGQERFLSMTRTYYRGAHSIIFIYDITNRQTFLGIQNHIQNYLNNIITLNSVIYMVIGNKTDLEYIREISEEEGLQLANQYNMLYTEISCKENEGIEEAFNLIVQKTKQIIENEHLHFQTIFPPVTPTSAPTRRYNFY